MCFTGMHHLLGNTVFWVASHNIAQSYRLVTMYPDTLWEALACIYRTIIFESTKQISNENCKKYTQYLLQITKWLFKYYVFILSYIDKVNNYRTISLSCLHRLKLCIWCFVRSSSLSSMLQFNISQHATETHAKWQ